MSAERLLSGCIVIEAKVCNLGAAGAISAARSVISTATETISIGSTGVGSENSHRLCNVDDRFGSLFHFRHFAGVDLFDRELFDLGSVLGRARGGQHIDDLNRIGNGDQTAGPR